MTKMPMAPQIPVRLSSPSRSLLRTIGEQLAAALAPPERELLELLGVSEFLTCLTVVRGERAAGRMILQLEKIDRVAALLRELGICCRRSHLDVALRSSLVKGTDHEASLVPPGTPGATRGLIYFGLTEEFSEGAEAVEIAREDRLLAQLFGYPDCCSRFFVGCQRTQFDKTPASIPDTGPFLRDMNPLLPYLYGIRLLFHFPCSPRCEPSLRLLGQRRSYLTRLAPASQALQESGAGIAIYGPEVGIALVTGYRRIDQDTYLAEEVTTGSEQSRSLFSKGSGCALIRLRSSHAFEIGGTVVNDQFSFAALFT